MSTPVLSNLDFGGVARGVNHPDPVNPQDIATRAYVLAKAWTGLEVQSFAAGTHTVTVAAQTTWLYINTTGNVVIHAIVRTGGNGGSKLHVLKNSTDAGTLTLRYAFASGTNMIHTPFDIDYVMHGVWAGASLEHNGFEWFIPDAKTGAAESFVGNFGSVPGTVNSRPGTSVAGNGLEYTAGGTLSINEAANLAWTGTHSFAGVATLLSQMVLGTVQTVGSALPLNITLNANTTYLSIDTAGDGEIQSISGATPGRMLFVQIWNFGTKTIKHSLSTGGIICPGLIDFKCAVRESFWLIGDAGGGGLWMMSGPPLGLERVANANMATMAARRLKGRADAAGTGTPQDLTGLQLGAIARFDNSIGDNTTTGSVPLYTIGEGSGGGDYLRS